ncbi:hypothetical protein [Sphingomonas sp. S2-65]|uniref:hypothetical protein n=1 Tax=Sphingomonas sp. S2-65 TaxID=2903960 RepID=UPI001F3A8643|nr:hypothetical protein [Sphingomonas sp. S2-65]UYY57997.1 hypothetical protein LZ586_15235 [Sphingomonas sp. S2-65]
MKIDYFVKRIGWVWLFTAPILIAGIAMWQVGSSACVAEMQIAAEAKPPGDAAWLCRRLFSVPDLTRISSTPPADLASMRTGVVGTFVAILFGLIALLAGYKSLLEGKEKRSKFGEDALACRCDLDATSGEVTASIRNLASTRVKIEGLKVENILGVNLLTFPSFELAPGEALPWTIFPAHGVLPSGVVIKGEAIAFATNRSTFVGEFNLGPSTCSPKRFDRAWF